MKKNILSTIIILSSLTASSQDLISGGTNSWIFHTPDDSRSSLHIAPKIGSSWSWGDETTFYNNGNVRFNGNVGIGTDKPEEKLQIGSTGFQFHDGGHKVMRFNPNTDNIGGIRYDLQNKRFSFETTIDGAYKAHFFIASNGNVNVANKLGIGTSKPDAPLTVKGKIHCEEVQVDLAVPADYVFEKYYTGVSELKEEYSMPTLAEIEVYTKENHHLPNIPSAKTIQEDGLHLKEMTNLLLQKIEELTLYTIEQEKRIKALEAQRTSDK